MTGSEGRSGRRMIALGGLAVALGVGVDEMIRDYLGDPRATQAKYLDKTVVVSGVLLEVERRDPQMVTLVISKQLGSKESPCACQGRPALEQAAARLSSGQRVTVRGKMVGMQQMQMVLLNCEIVPAAVDRGGTSSSR